MPDKPKIPLWMRPLGWIARWSIVRCTAKGIRQYGAIAAKAELDEGCKRAGLSDKTRTNLWRAAQKKAGSKS